MVNGFVVAAFALVVGGLIVGIDVPASSYPAVLVAALISAYGCTGFGLLGAGFGLLVREQAVLANILFGLLLIFTGANVPVEELPGWMQSISNALTFTASKPRAGSRTALPGRRVGSSHPRGRDRHRLRRRRLRLHPRRRAREPPLRHLERA